jgi:hypothetical protein
LPTSSSFAERAVPLGGVEEGDAEVDRGADEGNAILLVNS